MKNYEPKPEDFLRERNKRAVASKKSKASIDIITPTVPEKKVAPKPASPPAQTTANLPPTLPAISPLVRKQVELVVQEMLPSLIEAVEGSIIQTLSSQFGLSGDLQPAVASGPVNYKMVIVRGEDGKICEVKCEVDN